MNQPVRLGVNIDHVATLRQARGEQYPSIIDAARCVLDSGADQITIHLREDRRHIQDFDVPAVQLVTQRYGVPLNLEIGVSQEILEVAINTKPQWVCIVPEKREERTTEGGLDLLSSEHFKKVQNFCLRLRQECPNTKISLFVEADPETLKKCIELKVDAVEIHTGEFAIDYNQGEKYTSHLQKYEQAHQQLLPAGIGFHAGHGLTDESLKILIEQGLFIEYNIGHWVICDSLFWGLEKSVKKLKEIINRGSL